jgi:hypothetical protein
MHVEKFFVRNLGGLARTRAVSSGRLVKAISRTANVYVGEKSDKTIVPKKQPNKGESQRRMWREGS